MKYENISQVNEFINMKKLDKSKSTLISYCVSIEKFLDFMKVATFEDISKVVPSDGRAYQSFLLENKISKNSVNAYIRPLKVMYNFFVENEYISDNPFLKVKALKISKNIPAFLTGEEIDKLISATTNIRDRLMLVLLLSCGLRRNELVTLQVRDITNGHILINGKGSKQRRLALQPEVIELIDAYLDIRNEKWGMAGDILFISNKGTTFSGEAIRLKVISACRKAGFTEERIEEIHTHSLRHTFCANLIDSGADIRVIQGAMGHANMATTQIYAHLTNSTLDKALLNNRSIIK
jgi:integrase/recombinase XerC